MGADGLYSRVWSEWQAGENQLPAAPAVRVALYIRVSTADQNCEFQFRELQDYAAHQGWPVGGGVPRRDERRAGTTARASPAVG